VSILQVRQLTGTGTSNSVTMVNRSVFRYAGRVVQIQNVRCDGFTAYYARNSGDGTTIGSLSLPITPKYSNSLLLMEWFMYFEMQHDNVILIHQNDTLITTAGYEGYNSVQGNQRWSGFCPVQYDGDEDSTPQQAYICYAIPAGDTSLRRYAPAIRTSDGNDNRPFYLNKTFGLTPTDNKEMGVSFGTIMEIAQ
jgi:hypothetical protein